MSGMGIAGIFWDSYLAYWGCQMGYSGTYNEECAELRDVFICIYLNLTYNLCFFQLPYPKELSRLELYHRGGRIGSTTWVESANLIHLNWTVGISLRWLSLFWKHQFFFPEDLPRSQFWARETVSAAWVPVKKRLWNCSKTHGFLWAKFHQNHSLTLRENFRENLRRLLRVGGQLLVYCWSYEPGP